MSDRLIIPYARNRYEPHPAGQFVAVCVDCIDLGEAVVQYGDNPPLVRRRLAFVFRTAATRGAKCLEIPKEFNLSLAPGATLRAFIERWRGKPYTEEELGDGIPSGKLDGVGALLTIERKTAHTGNSYAVIAAIEPLPAPMAKDLPLSSGYRRASFWDRKKEENARKVAQFNQQMHKDAEETFSDDGEDLDDLPF